jgi:hypothetical protein
LLGIEQSLEQFLESERRDDLPGILKDAEAEATRLTGEIETLKSKGNSGGLETKQRYLGSRLERLEVLRKRQQRLEQAQENLALVVSEQERLDQQIKLIRADAVATKNAEALTARIDATVEHWTRPTNGCPSWMSSRTSWRTCRPPKCAWATRLARRRRSRSQRARRDRRSNRDDSFATPGMKKWIGI